MGSCEEYWLYAKDTEFSPGGRYAKHGRIFCIAAAPCFRRPQTFAIQAIDTRASSEDRCEYTFTLDRPDDVHRYVPEEAGRYRVYSTSDQNNSTVVGFYPPDLLDEARAKFGDGVFNELPLGRLQPSTELQQSSRTKLSAVQGPVQGIAAQGCIQGTSEGNPAATAEEKLAAASANNAQSQQAPTEVQLQSQAGGDHSQDSLAAPGQGPRTLDVARLQDIRGNDPQLPAAAKPDNACQSEGSTDTEQQLLNSSSSSLHMQGGVCLDAESEAPPMKESKAKGDKVIINVMASAVANALQHVAGAAGSKGKEDSQGRASSGSECSSPVKVVQLGKVKAVVFPDNDGHLSLKMTEEAIDQLNWHIALEDLPPGVIEYECHKCKIRYFSELNMLRCKFIHEAAGNGQKHYVVKPAVVERLKRIKAEDDANLVRRKATDNHGWKCKLFGTVVDGASDLEREALMFRASAQSFMPDDPDHDEVVQEFLRIWLMDGGQQSSGGTHRSISNSTWNIAHYFYAEKPGVVNAPQVAEWMEFISEGTFMKGTGLGLPSYIDHACMMKEGNVAAALIALTELRMLRLLDLIDDRANQEAQAAADAILNEETQVKAKLQEKQAKSKAKKQRRKESKPAEPCSAPSPEPSATDLAEPLPAATSLQLEQPLKDTSVTLAPPDGHYAPEQNAAEAELDSTTAQLPGKPEGEALAYAVQGAERKGGSSEQSESLTYSQGADAGTEPVERDDEAPGSASQPQAAEQGAPEAPNIRADPKRPDADSALLGQSIPEALKARAEPEAVDADSVQGQPLTADCMMQPVEGQSPPEAQAVPSKTEEAAETTSAPLQPPSDTQDAVVSHPKSEAAGSLGANSQADTGPGAPATEGETAHSVGGQRRGGRPVVQESAALPAGRPPATTQLTASPEVGPSTAEATYDMSTWEGDFESDAMAGEVEEDMWQEVGRKRNKRSTRRVPPIAPDNAAIDSLEHVRSSMPRIRTRVEPQPDRRQAPGPHRASNVNRARRHLDLTSLGNAAWSPATEPRRQGGSASPHHQPPAQPQQRMRHPQAKRAVPLARTQQPEAPPPDSLPLAMPGQEAMLAPEHDWPRLPSQNAEGRPAPKATVLPSFNLPNASRRNSEEGVSTKAQAPPAGSQPAAPEHIQPEGGGLSPVDEVATAAQSAADPQSVEQAGTSITLPQAAQAPVEQGICKILPSAAEQPVEQAGTSMMHQGESAALPAAQPLPANPPLTQSSGTNEADGSEPHREEPARGYGGTRSGEGFPAAAQRKNGNSYQHPNGTHQYELQGEGAWPSPPRSSRPRGVQASRRRLSADAPAFRHSQPPVHQRGRGTGPRHFGSAAPPHAQSSFHSTAQVEYGTTGNCDEEPLGRSSGAQAAGIACAGALMPGLQMPWQVPMYPYGYPPPFQAPTHGYIPGQQLPAQGPYQPQLVNYPPVHAYYPVPPMMYPAPYMPGPPVANIEAQVRDEVHRAMVRMPIEYYFSEENLSRDKFLRSNMTEDGWVAVAIVAGFPKVRSVTQDPAVIVAALETSEIVQLSVDGQWLRAWSSVE